MKKKHLITPVHVVSEQIAQTLTQSAELLDAFFKQPTEKELLNECGNLFDQVFGSLKLIDLQGAKMLMQEMILLLNAIKEGKASDLQTALELLIASTLFIPRYIEHFALQQNELSVLTLNSINAIRKTAGKNIIPEHQFVNFSLDSTLFANAQSPYPLFNSDTSNQQIKRLRHMYQVGLLGIMRELTISTHLKYINLALKRFSSCTTSPLLLDLFAATRAMVDALNDASLTLDSSVKSTFGMVDRAIKKAASISAPPADSAADSAPEPAEASAIQATQEAVKRAITAVCYYLSKCDSIADLVVAIKDRYQLGNTAVTSEAVLNKQRIILDAPDRSVMRRVSEEIHLQLELLKEQLDLLDRTGSLPTGNFEDPVQSLAQISTTLQMLDLGSAADSLDWVMAELKNIYSNNIRVEPGQINAIADKLILVENSLVELIQTNKSEKTEQKFDAHFTEAQENLIREARTEIDLIKEMLEEYIENFMDAAIIEGIPNKIHLVKGALQLLEFERAAQIFAKCHKFVLNILHNEQAPPSETEIEIFADTLASVEWYLECYQQYQQADDALLDVADEGIKTLCPS